MNHACKINDRMGCVSNEKRKCLIVYIGFHSFECKYCPICGYSYQPERTSEKDHIVEDNEMICDVPNTPTKGSESSRNE